MLYFSNKPAPTSGSMLPRPSLPSAVVNEPPDRRSLKRKLSASAETGDSQSGVEFFEGSVAEVGARLTFEKCRSLSRVQFSWVRF